MTPVDGEPTGTAPAGRPCGALPGDSHHETLLRAGDAARRRSQPRAWFRHRDLSGSPPHGAAGYHSSDPKWRETPAADRASFRVGAARPDASSSRRRTICIHPRRHYAFASVSRVHVPPGVEVVKEPRTLSATARRPALAPAPVPVLSWRARVEHSIVDSQGHRLDAVATSSIACAAPSSRTSAHSPEGSATPC